MVLFSNIILRFISITIMDKVKNNQRETCILKISFERELIFNFINSNSLKIASLNKLIKNNIVELKIMIVTSRIKLLETYLNKLMLETTINSLLFEHKKYLDKEDLIDEEDE